MEKKKCMSCENEIDSYSHNWCWDCHRGIFLNYNHNHLHHQVLKLCSLCYALMESGKLLDMPWTKINIYRIPKVGMRNF